MLTLNQIISQITNLGDNHSQIAEVGVGTFAELQASERNYPLLWIFHEQSDIEDGYFTNQIRLTVADRVITGEEGDDTEYSEQEVLSDTQYILVDFFAYFAQQHTQEYTVEKTGSFVPFTEKFNDRVAGNTVTLQIKQFYDFNKCQIPESGASIPPSVDGLTLYDFCDADVRARLTSEQVTCLQDNLCSCDPVTINVNGSLWASVASGGTLNGQVHDTADADVGTIIDGTEIEIADSTNEVNGVDISEGTVAEGTHNQQIHDSGGSDVGTAANPSVVSDATVTINGASLGATGDVVAEGSVDIAVEQSGAPVGSWTGSVWDVPVSGGGTIAVTVSDATPDLGDTITITATPSGITPSSYLYLSYNSSTGKTEFIAEQSGNTFDHVVNDAGSLTIYVIGVDGSDVAVGEEAITSTSTLLLDTVTMTGAAYSMRRLKAENTISCRVKRSSDNDAKTFGYMGEDLDTTAIADFVGANDGFELMLFDQNGSSDAVQANSARHPKLYISGTLQTVNGKPALFFTDMWFDIPTISPQWIFAVAQSTASSNNRLIGDPSGYTGLIWSGYGGGITAWDGSTLLTTGVNDLDPHQASIRWDASGEIWVDGVSEATSSLNARNFTQIGSVNGSTSFDFIGKFCEILMCTDDQSSNRTTIESDQSTYWGT